MEVFSYLFLFCILIILGIVAASLTVTATQHWNRGRGGAVLLAFSAPFLFVIYLLTAGYLRNSYHRNRAEAYSFDGEFSLPLRNGYYLSYFDEMPEDSDLAMSTWPVLVNSSVSKIDRIAWKEPVAAGHIHDGSAADETANPYFTLDTSNGVLQRYPSEEKMRAIVSGLGTLQTPDAFFRAVSSNQRSAIFWPLILATPFVAAGIVWKVRNKKPAP
jgi:hypothetical protein